MIAEPDAWDECAACGHDRDASDIEAVLREVTPETGCTLDRDQARDVLTDVYRLGTTDPRTDTALDRLAGCVRPVAGVTLTPEEARRARDWFSLMSEDVTPDAADRVLAARLEATR